MPLCPSCSFSNSEKSKFCARCGLEILNATESIKNPTSQRNALSSGDKAGHRSPGISSMPSKNVKKGFFFRVAPFLVGLIILLSVLVGLYNSLPISELTLNRSVLVLEIGDEEVVLMASVKPEFIKEKTLVWESSDPYVAEVSNEGVVSAKDIGLATITVSTEDSSHTATCEIKVVYPAIVWNYGIYVGQLENDIPNGQGEWLQLSGENYSGHWQDGRFNGEGTHTLSDGQLFAGEFIEGLLNGEGSWCNSNGDKYLGEFLEGKKHGQGVYTWADGSEYTGEFKEGLKDGQGILVAVDGKETKGEWKDDEYIEQITSTKVTSQKPQNAYTVGFKDGYDNYTAFFRGERSDAEKSWDQFLRRFGPNWTVIELSDYDQGYTAGARKASEDLN
jgi:hypothetical protein